MATERQHGVPYGEFQPGAGGFEKLVVGLTVSRYVHVKPLSTNRGDIYIRSKNGAGQGTGFRMEPTEPPTVMDTHYDNDLLEVKATIVGCTITFIGGEQ